MGVAVGSTPANDETDKGIFGDGDSSVVREKDS